MALWGGRFEGKADPLFKRFNDSLPFDYRLVQEDIAGSIAWADALHKVGVLTADEVARLKAALEDIAALAASNPEAVRDHGEEDVHSWVEHHLIEKIGPLGKKLHTGRSRNDQVATDFKLWTRAQVLRRCDEITAVQDALLRLADREMGVVFPGYTHLQRAQPILFSHWCLAYVEMLERDHARLMSANHHAGECPLGSGALAGTAYPIDRERLARSLGFVRATRNSLDAVSDRDFALEALAALSICALHLSRFAEDMIFYCTGEAAFIELPDALTSGSSLMPQKKNPDALELIRGKTGRVLGSLVALATTVKGLPLAYNKDMQEDKEPLFDAMETVSLSLRMIPPLLDGLKVRREAARKAAEGGYSNATELADYLVAKGVPFREAHDLVGRIVRRAIERGQSLEELPIDEMKTIAPQIERDVRVHLSIDSALAKRDVAGGTAPNQVTAALHEAMERIGKRAPLAPGTLVEVRPATLEDVTDICALVNYWTAKGENLPRSEEDVIRSIADFGVAVADDSIIGCASLLVYAEDLAEIRSLGVDPSTHGGGAGSKLVEFFVERAKELRIPRVFVLTRAPAFFDRLGFHIASIDTLPEKVWKDCRLCPKQNCCDEIAMVHEVPLD